MWMLLRHCRAEWGNSCTQLDSTNMSTAAHMFVQIDWSRSLLWLCVVERVKSERCGGHKHISGKDGVVDVSLGDELKMN